MYPEDFTNGASEMDKTIALVKRLRGYNPPDRTIDAQCQIAKDIHAAADEIARLHQKLVAAASVLNN